MYNTRAISPAPTCKTCGADEDIRTSCRLALGSCGWCAAIATPSAFGQCTLDKCFDGFTGNCTIPFMPQGVRFGITLKVLRTGWLVPVTWPIPCVNEGLVHARWCQCVSVVQAMSCAPFPGPVLSSSHRVFSPGWRILGVPLSWRTVLAGCQRRCRGGARTRRGASVARPALGGAGCQPASASQPVSASQRQRPHQSIV